MTHSGAGSAGADWAAIVLGVSTSESLIYARFDIALGLAADCSQLRDDKITRTFEHPLFAERERFSVAQIGQMLEHISHLEDITRPHFLGKFFKPIFPIISGRREII